jgi:hypothetical protein
MGRAVQVCGCMIAGLWGIGRQGKSNNSLVVGNWKVIGVRRWNLLSFAWWMQRWAGFVLSHPRLLGLMRLEDLCLFACLLQRPQQAAEKVKNSEKNCEIHPSAAKAGVNPIDLSARINSCPFKTALGTSFPQPVGAAAPSVRPAQVRAFPSLNQRAIQGWGTQNRGD